MSGLKQLNVSNALQSVREASGTCHTDAKTADTHTTLIRCVEVNERLDVSIEPQVSCPHHVTRAQDSLINIRSYRDYTTLKGLREENRGSMPPTSALDKSAPLESSSDVNV